MKKLKIIITLALCLVSISISADPRSYRIEIIVFSQNMPNSELLEQTQSLIKWPKRVSNLSQYNKIPRDRLRLRGSYGQLDRNQNYQPIIHIGWTQQVQSNQLGRAVNISGIDGSVNGFVRLQRGHLLHMIVDLEYSVGSTVYRLNEKRRFKLNEVHYLDHPKFGILARISPVG